MEPVQVPCDTSENTPPRGFLDFDKQQLDPVRREYMRKLRIKMLDFNEEYLSKHPQVEAVLRLIVMEVVCHKPFNVRQFIKQLLMSDNLETRVAKIILSKRINLERSHTRQYFKQVAELESKSGQREKEGMEPWVWPEPRPRRPTTFKDKPGYSHLHYFKEPYWLYPKEFLTVAEKSEEPVPGIPGLPAWVSGFRQAEFFQKWGPAFLSGTKLKPGGKAKRHRKCAVKLVRDLIRRQKKCKRSEPKRDQDEEEYKIFDGDVTEINKNRLINCSTCKSAVRGSQLAEGRGSTGYSAGRRTQTFHKSTMSRHLNKYSFETALEQLERDWRAGERLRVLRRDGRLEDERREALREVAGSTEDYPCPSVQCVESNALASTKWFVKAAGDEISFAIPENRLQGVDSKADPNEMLKLEDPAVPARYKTPLYQVVIPKKKTRSMFTKEQLPSEQVFP